MRSEMWEKNAVCPQNQPLLDYCIIMTCYGGIACLVCWISCVRGAPRTKTQWSLLYFIAFGEFVTNCVGMVFVLNAVKGLTRLIDLNFFDNKLDFFLLIS